VLHERPGEKLVRSKIRIVRIDRVTKVEHYLGQVEIVRDNLSSAVYLATDTAASGSRQQTLPNHEQLHLADPFANEFAPPLLAYFNAQRWFPQVTASAYQRLIAGRGLNGNENTFVRRHGASYEVHHGFADAHPAGITETVLLLDAHNYAPQAVSIF